MSEFENRMRAEGHDASCNLRDSLPGFQGCTCNKERHDRELGAAKSTTAFVAADALLLKQRAARLDDALSEIIHLDGSEPLATAQAIAYEARKS